MKLGIAHTSFEILAGSELTTLSLIEALKKTKHFTTLYTTFPPPVKETENFKIIKIPNRPSRFFKAYQQYDRGRKRLFKEIENEELLLIMGGGFMYEKNSVPQNILYCHSTFYDQPKFVAKKFKGWKGIFLKKMQHDKAKRLSAISDPKVHLISNSNYTKAEIKKQFNKSSRVVYPPVGISYFLKWYDIPKKNKVITLCRIDPTKNLEFAIDVIKETGLNYELAGFVKSESQKNFYNILLENIKNHHNIVIHSNLPKTEKEKLLSTAKVYFHTAHETFGITVVEAISAGCIPIVPNNSAHPDTVPFEILRYNEKHEAIEKLKHAINGDFDYLKPELKKHIEKFSVAAFQNNMIHEIESKN